MMLCLSIRLESNQVNLSLVCILNFHTSAHSIFSKILGDRHHRDQVCDQLADVTTVKLVAEPYPRAARLSSFHTLSTTEVDRT